MMTSLTYLACAQIAQPRAIRGEAQGMSIATKQRRTSGSRAHGSSLPPKPEAMARASPKPRSGYFPRWKGC